MTMWSWVTVTYCTVHCTMYSTGDSEVTFLVRQNVTLPVYGSNFPFKKTGFILRSDKPKKSPLVTKQYWGAVPKNRHHITPRRDSNPPMSSKKSTYPTSPRLYRKTGSAVQYTAECRAGGERLGEWTFWRRSGVAVHSTSDVYSLALRPYSSTCQQVIWTFAVL